MDKLENEINRAASILSKADNAVVSSGSGMSAESGIATFRDAGGLWDRLDPVQFGTADNLFNQLEQNADKLKPILNELLDSFEQADPNPGHLALAELEKMGILKTIITQNVDNLHQEAGNTDIIEVHGNTFRWRCLSCGSIKTLDRKKHLAAIKERLKRITKLDFSAIVSLAAGCDSCGSVMRPDVVMFGEAVQGLPRAFQSARDCDVMIVPGTSGVVYPAALLPIEAKNAGADIIVVNPKENTFASVSDVYIPMKSGEALPAVVRHIKEMSS